MAAIRCFLLFFVPSVAYGISAQWDLDPISGDWNTADNWTPNGVPNGPADVATFGLSNTTHVEISEDTEVNSIILTPAATNFYTITSSGPTLTISGVGFKNNSGFGLTFEQFGGTIRFTNSSTAGNAFIRNEGSSTNFFDRSSAGNASISEGLGGTVNFFDRSTAGSAFIESVRATNFFDSSTAGNASIYDSGSTNFFDRSTAGNSIITTFRQDINFFDRSTAGSAGLFGAEGGYANFFDNSTAGSAQIFFPGFGSGGVSFFDNSTAGSAFIQIDDQGTRVRFADNSTAGSATITLFDGFCSVFFEDSSQGGTARIHLNQGSILDISLHNAPGVTIGSIEGDGNVFLGANNVTIGSNNFSTTFSGVIQDGDQNGGTGGSLTKIGSGTLILSGASTYTGDTNVNRGVLQVDGSITSNTFVNHRGTLAGIGTIQGNVINNDLGIVRPGGALGSPGALTVVGNYTQSQYATLMIQIAGMGPDQFSALNVLGSANLNGFLDPVLLNGFVPTIGDSFTFVNYAFFTGEFSHIKHRVFDNGLQWSVNYEDNHASLTVVHYTPDQGSTFLLLTLGLLALVTFRRQLLREQP